MTQPEALRLADWLLDWLRFNAEPSDLEAAFVGAAAELRRLHEENESLRNSNEAKADRIDRLGETVEKLKAQRDELLEALKVVLDDLMYKDHARVIDVAHAAIAKAEGKT